MIVFITSQVLMRLLIRQASACHLPSQGKACGDRANECGGILRPVSAEPDAKHDFVIIHKCQKCGKTVRNRTAHEAKIQPDNMDLIIKLTALH